jgi:general secretion pathway protein G
MRARRGFTLIEMIVVLGIVGLLAAAAHPVLRYATLRQQEAELRHALRQIRGALDAYAYAVAAGQLRRPPGAPEQGPAWPPDLQTLVDGAPLAEGEGRRRFLRRLPRDPFGAEWGGAWGLRSSASPVDDPQPGADVFDVHSRSGRRALDGSFYRDW